MPRIVYIMFLLWFKFLFGLKIFKPIRFLFSFILDYGYEYETKENKSLNRVKILKRKKYLNYHFFCWKK